MEGARKLMILLADDDADDTAMIRKAIEKSGVPNTVYAVADGVELLDFLHHRGSFAPPAESPAPGIILLDLNMPRMDGHEALAEIKADPELRRIPVVVMTTSKAEQDVLRTYDLGGSSFITKPVTASRLAEMMQVIGQYWCQIVKLPELSQETV
jgi:two-component system, response regulator